MTHLMPLISAFGYNCDEVKALRENIQQEIMLVVNRHAPVDVDDLYRQVVIETQRYVNWNYEDFQLALWDLAYTDRLTYNRGTGVVALRLSTDSFFLRANLTASAFMTQMAPWSTAAPLRTSHEIRFEGANWTSGSTPATFGIFMDPPKDEKPDEQ